ncbi:MAG TPA: ATP-binding cassette domain-containing protein, partial [Gaiellaceae bacterium]
MANGAPLLDLRNISKAFGSVQALTDVDFEVKSGEVMALVGDNGAGKSTLIKCVAGIITHDKGEIFFDGKLASI